MPVCYTQNPEAGSDLLGSNSFVSYAGTVSMVLSRPMLATKTTATATKDKTRFLLLLFSLSLLSLFPHISFSLLLPSKPGQERAS